MLFVCPAGTVKSAIAREFLKRRAAQEGLAVQVRSRAIHAEQHVSPRLAARLAADGINPAAETVRNLSPRDIADANIVIAFDEAAAAPGMERAKAWAVPSWNDDYDAAKVALMEKLDGLLVDLRTRQCA